MYDITTLEGLPAFSAEGVELDGAVDTILQQSIGERWKGDLVQLGTVAVASPDRQ
jgi:hypothetical protein